MLKSSSIIRIAKAVAFASQIEDRCIHVAMLMHGRRIMSIGMNQHRTHPIAKLVKIDRPQPTKCAELNCLLNFGYNNRDKKPDFTRYTLVVLRIKDGMTSLSKPCISCQILLKQVMPKKILYSIEGESLVELKLN